MESFHRSGAGAVTVCWAVKGGTGTTLITAAMALNRAGLTLLVDLDGELPAVLGLPDPQRAGVGDWFDTALPTTHLGELLVEVALDCWLLPWSQDRSRPRDADHGRWPDLGAWLRDWSTTMSGRVLVDAGTGDPAPDLLSAADHRLLVTRACYLSLTRAQRAVARPTGAVLVSEPGRALDRRAVESSVGAPVIATVPYDPAVARAVDAGLLIARTPLIVSRQLRRIAA